MHLKPYFFALDAEAREKFARDCGTTAGHLVNVAYGYRKPSTELCVAIEQQSAGFVTRKDLRPDDWQKNWPELGLHKPTAMTPKPRKRNQKPQPIPQGA